MSEVNQLFTPKEQADLDTARSVRMRIIKEFTEDELPKAFDMDRLITTVSHLEAAALTQAKIRIKQQEADGKDVNTALLAKLVYDTTGGGSATIPEVIDGEFVEVNDDDFILPDNLDVEPPPGTLRQGDQDPELYDEIFGRQDQLLGSST